MYSWLSELSPGTIAVHRLSFGYRTTRPEKLERTLSTAYDRYISASEPRLVVRQSTTVAVLQGACGELHGFWMLRIRIGSSSLHRVNLILPCF